MTAINPNDTNRNWRTAKREPSVLLFLSGVEGDAAALVTARAAGFALSQITEGARAGPNRIRAIPVSAPPNAWCR